MVSAVVVEGTDLSYQLSPTSSRKIQLMLTPPPSPAHLNPDTQVLAPEVENRDQLESKDAHRCISCPIADEIKRAGFKSGLSSARLPRYLACLPLANLLATRHHSESPALTQQHILSLAIVAPMSVGGGKWYLGLLQGGGI